MIKVDNKKFERDLKKFSRKNEREFSHRLNQSTLAMTKMAKSKAPTNEGKLRQGIRSEVERKGLTGATISEEDYSQGVEEGTKPHWPNMKSIKRWVELKLSVPRKDSANVAFLVSRKISRKGTDPQPFLMPAWQKASKDFMKGLRRVFK